MLRPLALTDLHEGHKNEQMCFKEQQSLCNMESFGTLEQHIRKVFWKVSGRGLAYTHTHREGSDIHAHALLGSNILGLEPVTAGYFLCSLTSTFFFFTPGSPSLQLPPGCLPFSRLLSHTPFIILGQIPLVLTGEFFSSLTTPGSPVVLDFGMFV